MNIRTGLHTILLGATILWSVSINTRTGIIATTALDQFAQASECQSLLAPPYMMTVSWQYYRYVHLCLPDGQRPELNWLQVIQSPPVPPSQ